MKSTFGERLAYALNARNMTQGDLATLLGSSPAFISTLIQGRKNAGYVYLVQVSNALNLDMNWLMLGKGEMDLSSVLSEFNLPKSHGKEENTNIAYINKRLKEIGVSRRDIAEGLGVTQSSISNTINFKAKCYSIAIYIAGLLNEDVHKLWPDTYVFKPRKKSSGN